MTEETYQTLLAFFKALADETRLKIVGLLARENYSGEQLAAILDLKPATISHHLNKLTEADLISIEAEGHSKLYRLRLDTLHTLAGQLLPAGTGAAMAPGALTQAAETLDLEAYDRKVLKDFLRRDGTLREIPAQRKKLQAVLRHLLTEFTPGHTYSEKRVNEILGRYHTDTASLRRAMIDFKLMERANGQYWRKAS